MLEYVGSSEEIYVFGTVPFFRNCWHAGKLFAESKTRTYHWRVGTERTAEWRGGVGQD